MAMGVPQVDGLSLEILLNWDDDWGYHHDLGNLHTWNLLNKWRFPENYTNIVDTIVTWSFTEIGVPLNHPFIDGIFHERNQPALGDPQFMETCMCDL